MIVDTKNIENERVIETDVCIVGTGPAGLSIAQELVGQSFQVCLLESGGLEREPEVQVLSEGAVVTQDDYPYNLSEVRTRQYGGMSQLWTVELPPEQELGVRYAQLDAIDFQHRPWVPHSGWCFDFEHLTPFYQRAQTLCRLGPCHYNADHWQTPLTPTLPLDSSRVKTTCFQFGPKAVFTQTVRQQLAQSSNISVYLHANVVELDTDDAAQTVTRVRVATLDGKRFWVKAKFVVLATSAVENARLLLVSNRVQPAGLGNQHDVVGRYFMDHPQVVTGTWVPTDRQVFEQTALYDKRRVDGTVMMAKLALADPLMRQQQLLNLSAVILPRYWMRGAQGVKAAKFLVQAIRQGKGLGAVLRELQTLVADLGGIWRTILNKVLDYFRPPIPADLATGGWSEWQDKARKFRCFYVYSQTEQAPHPDNRIVLDDAKDALGYPKAKLYWQWHREDIEQVKRGQEALAAEIARAGLGQLHLARTRDDQPVVLSGSSHHLMGTTRMHTDPKQGVVDANCQVHGVSNLFLAGSSVFPTGGYANPTLTIVALSIRLADHLKQRIQSLEPLQTSTPNAQCD